MFQKYVSFVLQLGVSMILARLLTPAETGVFSLAAAVVAFGHLLRDFGVSDYLVSQRDVSDAKVRAAFTLTIMLAWGIAALLWLLAWPMAEFYKEPGLAPLIQVLCVSFALLPFGTTAFAMLSRDMQFQKIFYLQITATTLGSVVTVICAWQGFSYMSMAIGAVVTNATTILFLSLLQPGTVFLRPTLVGLSEVTRFGGTLTVARALEQVSARSGDFIVNGMLGFHSGGLLSKAGSLIGSFHEFFNSAVTRVATPAFASARNNAGDVRSVYLKTTLMVATALWIFFPILGLYAHEAVLILFGEKWLGCVPVVQVMAAGSMLWAPFMLSNSMLTAQRAASAQVRIQALMLPITLLALVIGAAYSLVAVVLLLTAATVVRLFLVDREMRRVCSIGVEDVLKTLGPTAVIALVAVVVGASWKVFAAIRGLPAWVVLPVGVISMLAAAALTGRLLRHPIYVELAQLTGRMRRGQRAND